MDDHRGHNVYFLYTIQRLKPPHMSASGHGLTCGPSAICVMNDAAPQFQGSFVTSFIGSIPLSLVNDAHLTSCHSRRTPSEDLMIIQVCQPWNLLDSPTLKSKSTYKSIQASVFPMKPDMPIWPYSSSAQPLYQMRLKHVGSSTHCVITWQ
jgi:hypothetical protein